MSIKTFVSARVSSFLLSERRLESARAGAERARRRAGAPHRIEFFHQVDDPYSHLLAQALIRLEERYDVEVVTWLVAPPPVWAAPERGRLESYSLVDARRLARKAGLSFDGETRPCAESVEAVQSELVAKLATVQEPGATALLRKAVDLGDRLWRGETIVTDGSHQAEVEAALRAGSDRRESLGHYLGGTCLYGGEWTWGIDRLAFLEERLAALGAQRSDTGRPDTAGDSGVHPVYSQPLLLERPVDQVAMAAASLPDLHFFASFRSPYTYIVTERVMRLAEAFGVNLRIRFVLPMVMRGLPVRRSKRLYILRDAAREARRCGVPFAPIADPVGRGVERGYSLLPWAIEQGRGADYSLSFMTHVWSRAVDAAGERGLRRIVDAAGLDWREARGHLDDPAWQESAEQNRQELLDLGLWGVPSFRIGELAAWGQDRLWVLEEEYRRRSYRAEPRPTGA